MKIKFTDTKKSNLIFKDYDYKGEYDEEGNPVIYTEEAYEGLLNKAYKGRELADFYEIASLLCDLLDEVYDDLGYPRNTTWFIDPEVLKDDAKMKKLYETLRQRVLDELNSGNIDYDYNLRPEQHDDLKKIFKLKYTFEDRKYVKDAEFEEELEEAEENSNNKSDEDPEEDEGKFLNATCKEFLEEYEDKIDKKDPRWYLIQMALDKDKGWAYIKEAKNLKGEVDLDVVTPKNAKTILKESRSS